MQENPSAETEQKRTKQKEATFNQYLLDQLERFSKFLEAFSKPPKPQSKYRRSRLRIAAGLVSRLIAAIVGGMDAGFTLTKGSIVLASGALVTGLGIVVAAAIPVVIAAAVMGFVYVLLFLKDEYDRIQEEQKQEEALEKLIKEVDIIKEDVNKVNKEGIQNPFDSNNAAIDLKKFNKIQILKLLLADYFRRLGLPASTPFNPIDHYKDNDSGSLAALPDHQSMLKLIVRATGVAPHDPLFNVKVMAILCHPENNIPGFENLSTVDEHGNITTFNHPKIEKLSSQFFLPLARVFFNNNMPNDEKLNKAIISIAVMPKKLTLMQAVKTGKPLEVLKVIGNRVKRGAKNFISSGMGGNTAVGLVIWTSVMFGALAVGFPITWPFILGALAAGILAGTARFVYTRLVEKDRKATLKLIAKETADKALELDLVSKYSHKRGEQPYQLNKKDGDARKQQINTAVQDDSVTYTLFPKPRTRHWAHKASTIVSSILIGAVIGIAFAGTLSFFITFPHLVLALSLGGGIGLFGAVLRLIVQNTLITSKACVDEVESIDKINKDYDHYIKTSLERNPDKNLDAMKALIDGQLKKTKHELVQELIDAYFSNQTTLKMTRTFRTAQQIKETCPESSDVNKLLAIQEVKDKKEARLKVIEKAIGYQRQTVDGLPDNSDIKFYERLSLFLQEGGASPAEANESANQFRRKILGDGSYPHVNVILSKLPTWKGFNTGVTTVNRGILQYIVPLLGSALGIALPLTFMLFNPGTIVMVGIPFGIILGITLVSYIVGKYCERKIDKNKANVKETAEKLELVSLIDDTNMQKKRAQLTSSTTASTDPSDKEAKGLGYSQHLMNNGGFRGGQPPAVDFSNPYQPS